MTTALLDDGSVPLTADWDIGSGRMIKARVLRARDINGITLQTNGGTYILELDGNGHVLLSAGRHMSVREVRALDVNGLSLYNDSGDGGIDVADNGNVSFSGSLTVAATATFNGRVVAPFRFAKARI